MARLSDVPVVLRRVGVVAFVRRVWREVGDDHLLTWGAALAYSWLFAVFPFFIFLLTLLPYLPDRYISQAKPIIQDFLWTWLPDPSAWTLWQNIEGILERPRTGLLSVGLLVTIWAASGGVNMTMTALDKCYEIERGRGFFRRRLVAISITLLVASMVLAVLVLIPIGTLATHFTVDYWNDHQWYFPRWILWTWNIARYALAGILMFMVVAIVYFYGISVKQKWRVLSPGSVFSIAVWILLGITFRWYVNTFGKENYNRTYGTVGGVAVLLLFFYLDALVLMIGAEINSEIDFEILKIQRGTRDFRPAEQAVDAGVKDPKAATDSWGV
jgi:membrane protein